MRKRPLRVAIATAGRFHVLDLGRELSALGHEVRFYSYVPRKRALSFGLPPECHVDLFPFLAPLAFLQLRAPKLAPKFVEWLTWQALNRAVIATLEACDVFIFMSGMYLEAAEHARAKFGAKLVLVRSSKHILAQDEILAALPGAERPSALAIRRELQGYQLADRICIPSAHVLRSFERDPTAYSKTMTNPYGVDLRQFPLLPRRPRTETPTFVMAGTWCLRKGCDLLYEAIRQEPALGLVHVGEIGDCPFPQGNPRIRHIPKINQDKLSQVYEQADAFVLASREEGLSNVITQALASGLPIVCSEDSGGVDLGHTAALKDRILVVKSGDLGALGEGIQQMRRRLANGPDFAPVTETDRDTLTWRAFAQRDEVDLMKFVPG